MVADPYPSAGRGQRAIEDLGDLGRDDRGRTPGAQQDPVPVGPGPMHRLGMSEGSHAAVREGPVEIDEYAAAVCHGRSLSPGGLEATRVGERTGARPGSPRCGRGRGGPGQRRATARWTARSTRRAAVRARSEERRVGEGLVRWWSKWQ